MKNLVVAVVCAAALSGGVVNAASLQDAFAIDDRSWTAVSVAADSIDFAPFTEEFDGVSALGTFQPIGGDDELKFVLSSLPFDGTELPVSDETPFAAPEPANLVIMGLAMSGVAIALRRRTGVASE